MSPIRSHGSRSIWRASIVSLVLLSTVLGGCIATPGGVGEQTDGTATATPTATATTTDPATPTTSPVHPPLAAERAISAEKDRIRQLNDSHPQVRGLGIGILRTPEWELLERNRTGVILQVEVGYSAEIYCNESGGSGAVDGAATVTRYFVTDYEVRLLSVETTFVDPARYCE